jgi:hypothetical protein
MRGFNEWQERDVQDRSSELRGVTARIDQLREDLHRIQSNNQYMTDRSVVFLFHPVLYLSVLLVALEISPMMRLKTQHR